ncbi:hypothetical protein TIFTF001_013808 [Ficus carica]|uniref:Uncharacterized protein n=1 Tax=Ficus carica TaxID=3494 RepID=A0AA88A4Z6_FICCA|nr:hypothetical protein TIFTF001_013808 [Ficus carica]
MPHGSMHHRCQRRNCSKYNPIIGRIWSTFRSLTTEGQAAVHRCTACADMEEEKYMHVKRVGELMLGPENVKDGKKFIRFASLVLLLSQLRCPSDWSCITYYPCRATFG